MKAVGYARVSTEEQGESGAGLDAQRAAIRSFALSRGFELVEMVAESSNEDLAKRPGLQRALTLLQSGAATTLIAAKLDRISRSTLDFLSFAKQCDAKSWNLVILDVQIDTTTPVGKLLLRILASFAEFERDMIRHRTKSALAEKKRAGVQLGRRSNVSLEARILIESQTRLGTSYGKIARMLTDNQLETPQKGRAWYASTIRAIEASTGLAKLRPAKHKKLRRPK